MADLGQIPEIPVEIGETGPSKLRKIIVTVLTILIGIVVGGAALYFVGPRIGIINIPGKDQPSRTPVLTSSQASQRIADLETRLEAYTVLGSAQDVKGKFDELMKRQQAQGTMDQVAEKIRDAQTKEAEYDALTKDLESLNEKMATTQGSLDDKNRQVAEAESRIAGLRTEVARFEEQVGKLEDADGKRQAAKTELIRDLDRLIIQIRKSIPLAPPECKREDRLARAEKLREELQNSNWVKPELLGEYTQLYLEELTVATQEKYFLAGIPLVENKKPVMKWAECVSIGNRQTYFETLDRKFTGVCRNANPQGSVPRYEFIVDLPREELTRIRDLIAQYRPANYEELIKAQLGDEAELLGKRPTAVQEKRAT